MLFIFGFIGFLVCIFMYLTSFLLSYKKIVFFKLCSYECGFDSLTFSHFGLSFNIFLLVSIFVIFELEIIMFIMIILSDYHTFFIFFLFFFMLFLVFMESWYGKLIWLI
uniref:NADH-ubiquinone oxidoreductase chain 3 n=1 Tax=Heliconema longissimum TaxID=657295 RepID=G4V235_9BILA|nr:NADH dehydrogenase subunit 3 [Heliconema longissimum]ACV96722.1 NADH dehydrogenase subunit 3 [Heliconema longissimum]